MISRFECISLVLTARHSRKDGKNNWLLRDQKCFSAKYLPPLKSCAGFEVHSGSLNFLFFPKLLGKNSQDSIFLCDAKWLMTRASRRLLKSRVFLLNKKTSPSTKIQQNNCHIKISPSTRTIHSLVCYLV